MKAQKIDQLLAARAQSPTPRIEPDPFLPTRVRALVRNATVNILPGWRISTLIGVLALLLGVYIGNGFNDTTTSVSGNQSYTVVYDLSGALYQETLSDDFSVLIATLDKGENE